MEVIKQILTRHLTAVRDKIAVQMASYGRNASGKSVASLTIDVNENVGRLTGLKSFLVMERGKKPGKVPFGFVGIIRQWILDKGIAVTPIPYKRGSGKYTPEERGLRSLAGAIAYNIMKKGTKLHRDNGYNDIYTSAINDEIKAMGDEFIVFTSKSILDINQTL